MSLRDYAANTGTYTKSHKARLLCQAATLHQPQGLPSLRKQDPL